MLNRTRIVSVGQTPYAHEREALRFIEESLPDTDPYHLWELVDLLDPSTGRLYEIDALVIGYWALYLVEIKSGPGRYSGDDRDWFRTPPESTRPLYMDPPLGLANHKCKVLKSRLVRKMSTDGRNLRVEPLVFLSAPELTLDLRPDGMVGVVNRDTVVRAITRHEFPGAPTHWRGDRIDRRTTRDIAQALEAIGVRPRKGALHVSSYELRDVIEEGPGYQDRAAVHRQHESFRARARVYLIPEQTSVERRQQLLRAADREALILLELREHAGILHFSEFVSDAPLGPTVLFEDVPDAVRLDTFLRQNPELSFNDRIELIVQVGRALSFCHRKQIVHGALGPHAVLVRRRPDDGKLQARLYNFQLAAGTNVSGTVHWSALASEPWRVYQAPELREDPTRGGPSTDMFSLGALAFFVLTGRPPGQTFVEVDALLEVTRHLDPRVMDDTIPEKVAEAIACATDLATVRRFDDVGEWVELLELEATAPNEPEVAELDPLEARVSDMVGDLMVERALGQGATARVLKVMREDNRSFALKVSLSSEHDERLAREAEALRKLRHPRIVELIDERVIADRKCLLISMAGDTTLQRELREQGAMSLDYAARYGEDLLSALMELEEKQVLHRDIKPANLGVGTASKSTKHLTLFDFSLEGVRPSELGVGTTAYRDPFLRNRGVWDAAADRWGAAVTLHELLTGVRPQYGGESGTALDPEAPLVLAAERFDPAVRGRLVAFFEKAMQRDAEQRYVSAKEMMHAWIHAFEAPATLPPPDVKSIKAAGDPALLSEEQLARVLRHTPVEALPLSPRARSALDRAGITLAEELLNLPDNHLSGVRGVGRLVAQEILGFRDRWKQLRDLAAPEPTPLFPGYRGDDLLLGASGLDPRTVEALVDGGLCRLSAVASASSAVVERLCTRAEVSVDAVRSLLAKENARANERERPSTVEGWLEALLPRKGNHRTYLLAHFGLEAPFAPRTDVRVRELADHFAVTRPAVYIALGKSRGRWSGHAAMGELREAVRAAVEALGGAASLDRAAEALLQRLPHDAGTEPDLMRAKAAALVRVVGDVERDDPEGLRVVMLRDTSPWVVTRQEFLPLVARLGDEADGLASRAVLVAPGEAARTLLEVVAGTAFERLSPDRLVDLATAASTQAARSTRLEIYPRGMPASRALELTATALPGKVSAEAVKSRVTARYPDAAALPDRPELDQLLEHLGLVFNPEAGVYERPGERTQATHTSASFTSFTTVPSSTPRVVDARTVSKREFEDGMRAAIERKALRVLGVTADAADTAAMKLRAKLDLSMVSFDEVFLAKLDAIVRKRKISPDVVHQADREGPGGRGWSNLLKIANEASEQVAAELFPAKHPMLLIRPGLLARYRLEGFLGAMIASSAEDSSESIVLLVPSRDTGGVPKINGELSIPGLLSQQASWIPRAWLGKKEH